MDNAVILGYGRVGQATGYAFGIRKYYDHKGSNITLLEASQLRYHFICLPTNLSGGRYDVQPIRELIKQIMEYGGGQNIFILRSTVLPGTCRAMTKDLGVKALVYVPEFLSEMTWQKDMEWPDIIVIGGERENYRKEVVGLYKARYRGSDIIETDTPTAELTKCAINAFYSTKVIFANEIYEIAQKTGANYETIKNAMYKRKWIGKNHLDVWYKRIDWDKPKRGLHGKCLPKDLEALAEFGNSLLLKTVVKLNEQYKRG